jgi:hypothetical protein
VASQADFESRCKADCQISQKSQVSEVCGSDFLVLKDDTGEHDQSEGQPEADDNRFQDISHGGCASEQLRHAFGSEQHRWQGLSDGAIQCKKEGQRQKSAERQPTGGDGAAEKGCTGYLGHPLRKLDCSVRLSKLSCHST